jgi:hypothetical protein
VRTTRDALKRDQWEIILSAASVRAAELVERLTRDAAVRRGPGRGGPHLPLLHVDGYTARDAS